MLLALVEPHKTFLGPSAPNSKIARLPQVMGQAAEGPVPREDLAIRVGEEGVGVKEKAQLRKRPDQDLSSQPQHMSSESSSDEGMSLWAVE